jgi:hypothetical protein
MIEDIIVRNGFIENRSYGFKGEGQTMGCLSFVLSVVL